jgi:restriction system protein
MIIILRLNSKTDKSNNYHLKPKEWDKMSGLEFEKQIVIWLKLVGYKQVRKTEYFDQGIDIIAAKPGKIVGVQVKRSNKPVGIAAVRAAVTGLKIYGCSHAMVVTNYRFTNKAISLAKTNDCQLVNGIDLKKSILKY